MKQQSFDHVRERCFLIILSICVSSLVERRISNERVDVARNLSSRSSSAGSFHPPEAKKDLSRLSCADSSRPPEAKNYFISSAGGRNTMTGPTGLRFSGGSAGKIRVRACAYTRVGLGLGLALASPRSSFHAIRRRPCAGFLVPQNV